MSCERLNEREAAGFLRQRDRFLILTHKRPDGDTLGCAAALCHMLRGIGKRAALLRNEEVTERYLPYVDGLWAPADYDFDTVVCRYYSGNNRKRQHRVLRLDTRFGFDAACVKDR